VPFGEAARATGNILTSYSLKSVLVDYVHYVILYGSIVSPYAVFVLGLHD
jgi:hypothetical protein